MQVSLAEISVRDEADELEVRFDPHPPASGRLESVRQRHQVRIALRWHQVRDSLEPLEPELPAHVWR